MNERFVVPGVQATSSLADAAPRLLLSKAEPLFALETAARGGADVEAVHDMRVASRRLRETMRLLEPVYPRREFRDWYRRVRAITRALGPVRDSDVFIEEFADLVKSLGEGGRRAVAFLIGYRMGRREYELAELDARLARLDLAGSRRGFDRMTRQALVGPAAVESLASFAHAAVASRAATVFGAQPAALAVENVSQQHELRIDYKRLRYAVEVFAPCYDDAFDDLHRTLTAFQDTLGELHDAHVFFDMLRAPERASDAKRAGVRAADLAEVEAVLDERAAAAHARFVGLVAEYPAEWLLSHLLLPLARVPEPAVGAGEPLEPDEAAATIAMFSPVVVGDEPWAEPLSDGDTIVEAVPEPFAPTTDVEWVP